MLFWEAKLNFGHFEACCIYVLYVSTRCLLAYCNQKSNVRSSRRQGQKILLLWDNVEQRCYIQSTRSEYHHESTDFLAIIWAPNVIFFHHWDPLQQKVWNKLCADAWILWSCLKRALNASLNQPTSINSRFSYLTRSLTTAGVRRSDWV